jgi:hypothetical protein
MNIFALYPSPRQSARAHCDQHLHKMILESAQLVSSAFYLRSWHAPWMYKPAYLTHPCTKWAAESNHNIMWIIDLADELEVIRQELDHPYHSSSEVIKYARDFLGEELPYVRSDLAYPRTLAMPIHIKMRQDISIEQKYQEYYRWKNTRWTALDKRPMTWKNRPVPSFMIV